jgi:hypothetical protein
MTGGLRLSRRGWLAFGGGGVATLLGLAPRPARAVGPEEGREVGGDRLERLRRGRLPSFATEPEVARLYRFAVERPDVLRYFPCFCGCGRAGHRDNRDCYVRAEHPDGTVTYTSHAAT